MVAAQINTISKNKSIGMLIECANINEFGKD